MEDTSINTVKESKQAKEMFYIRTGIGPEKQSALGTPEMHL